MSDRRAPREQRVGLGRPSPGGAADEALYPVLCWVQGCGLAAALAALLAGLALGAVAAPEGPSTFLMNLGLLLLMLTPLAGIAAAGAFFLFRRDRFFAGLTGLLMLVLAIGFWLGT